MKSNIYAFIFICYVQALYSQGNYPGSNVSYESCTNCTSNYNYSGQIEHYATENIISDFGPRYLSNNIPYDFHGGIDYTITQPNNAPAEDLGYHIVAIEGGVILRNRIYPSTNPNSNLKYMVIDGPGSNDYGYLHLFDDTALPTTIGDMVYTTIFHTIPNVNVYGTFDVTNSVLYSDCNGGACDSTFYYIYNSDTIYATNQVAANAPIGILGTSGNVGSHLHLSKYNTLTGITDFVNNDDNAVDPFETCAHEGPDYDVKILKDSIGATIDQYPDGIHITYPGHDESSILIRPIMPDIYNGQPNDGILSNANRYYVDNTMNIHKVGLWIKKSNAVEYDFIKGPFYESRFELGARLNENTKYPAHISERNANSVGHWNRTGIHPLAYKTNSPRRWDDYYFADFITRIHKDDPMDGNDSPTLIADDPRWARYNDGLYHIYAEVTDVREGEHASNVHGFRIDNFMPYIDLVEVYVGAELIYQRNWNFTDANPGIPNDGVINLNAGSTEKAIGTSGIEIYAYSSEPMEFLSATIPDLSPNTFQGVFTDENQMVWRFNLGPLVSAVEDSCYTIHFSGEDINANPLLDLRAMANGQDMAGANIHIPKRQNSDDDANTWLPAANYTGTDDVHEF